MSDTQKVFTLLAVVCLLWQTGLVVMAASMVRSGQYRNVKFGLLPFVLSVIFAVLAILA